MESAPNARARFFLFSGHQKSFTRKNRFCYDKENRQLQTEMLTEYPGQMVKKIR